MLEFGRWGLSTNSSNPSEDYRRLALEVDGIQRSQTRATLLQGPFCPGELRVDACEPAAML